MAEHYKIDIEMTKKKIFLLVLFFSITYTNLGNVIAQDSGYVPSPSVFNLVSKGMKAHDNRDFSGAISSFKEALSIEPNNELVRENLSVAHNNYGKYLAERTDYEKSLQQFRLSLYYKEDNDTARANLDGLLSQRGVKAKDAQARKQIGDRLRASAEFELALVEYRIAQSLSEGKNPEILIAIGDIYYIIYLREGQKTNDIQKALDSYKEALLVKESAKAHIKVGDGLLGLRDVVQAIDHYKKALDLEPDNPEVLTANVRGWNEAIRLAPLVAENHVGLAHALQLKKDFDSAEEEYKQALKLSPNNAAAKEGLKSLEQDKQASKASKYLELALKLQEQGKYDEAIKEYVQAVEINPNDPKLHYNIGTAFQGKSDFDHAKKAYKKALDLDPANEKARVAMESLDKIAENKKIQDLTSRAVELQNSGNYQEAITTYLAAISLSPEDAQLVYNLGTAYQASGDNEKAKEQYLKASSMKSENDVFKNAIKQIDVQLADPFIKSAIQKQNASDLLGAINDYSKALEYTPNDPQIHFNLATAYQAGKQLDNAVESYKKAVSLDPKGQAEAIFFVASIYEEQKKNKLALSEFQNYLKKSPSGTYAKDAKAHIEYLKSLPQ